MAGVWTRASILLRDRGGNIAKVAVLVAAAALDPAGGAINALQIAFQAITLALSPRAESGTARGGAGGTPGTGSFAAVEDRATLTFAAADGSTMLFEVPAPVDACFITGTDIVDPDGIAIAAVISFIQDNTKSKYNQALTFVKGKRTRKKQMKK
jgi:hypothetical protein